MGARTPEAQGARGQPAKCLRCTHYFVTYDPYFPHGCRAMALKSKSMPHREVEQASGFECQAFDQKAPG